MRLMGFGLFKPKNPVLGRTSQGPSRRPAKGSPASGRRRSLRHRQGLLRRVRRRPRGQARPQAGRLSFEQAAAMRVSGLTALRALDAAGAAGIDTCSWLARPAVSAPTPCRSPSRWAHRHRRRQRLEGRPGHRAGRPTRIDYTTRGLRRRLAHLRRGPRHRRDDAGLAPAPALTPDRDAGHRRRRERQHVEPWHGRQLNAAPLSPFVAQRLTSVMNKEHYSGLERLARLAADGSSPLHRAVVLRSRGSRRVRRLRPEGPRPGRHHDLTPDHRRATHCSFPPGGAFTPASKLFKTGQQDHGNRDLNQYSGGRPDRPDCGRGAHVSQVLARERTAVAVEANPRAISQMPNVSSNNPPGMAPTSPAPATPNSSSRLPPAKHA